jgi:hypothetical protein
MKIITLLAILFVGWIIYSLIQSNNNIQRELREIRLKCINNGTNTYSSSNDTYTYDESTKTRLKTIQNTLVSGLTNLISSPTNTDI